MKTYKMPSPTSFLSSLSWFLPTMFVIVIAVATILSSAFAQTDCIVAAPCHCDGNTINCRNLNLTSVPKLAVSKTNYSSLNLDLSGNRVEKVPDNAFFNLSTTNCTYIVINLDSNIITDFELGAFNGINDSVRDLQLNDNKLIFMPKALLSLSHIQTLSISQNEIHEFDPSVMQSLGPTLTTLRIGADTDFKWPPEFQYLFRLQTLSIFNFEQDSLPIDAFRGFEKTLTTLYLEYTKLSTIPEAVCRLSGLRRFSFNSNTHLSSTRDILPVCIPSLSSIRTAFIVGDNLDVFPPVFDTFPSLNALRLTNNSDLNYIDETTVDGASFLTILDISFNGFDQFPESLQKVQGLQYLKLVGNKIRTIEEYNIPNMTTLTYLDFSLNPISHISQNAFRDLSNLESLNLDDVALAEFPKAVIVLTELKTLSLNRNTFVCSCSMTWILTEWKTFDKVTISGNCGTSSLSLADYIAKYLPDCPELQKNRAAFH